MAFGIHEVSRRREINNIRWVSILGGTNFILIYTSRSYASCLSEKPPFAGRRWVVRWVMLIDFFFKLIFCFSVVVKAWIWIIKNFYIWLRPHVFEIYLRAGKLLEWYISSAKVLTFAMIISNNFSFHFMFCQHFLNILLKLILVFISFCIYN